MQSMHPVRTTRTDRERAINARFGVGVKSWTALDPSLSGVLAAHQTRNGGGVPGAWLGSLLSYMDGNTYRYPHALYPFISPKIDGAFGGPEDYVLILDQGPTLPFTHLLLLLFHRTEQTRYAPLWINVPWLGSTVLFKSHIAMLDRHVLALPHGGIASGIVGTPDCVPIPHP